MLLVGGGATAGAPVINPEDKKHLLLGGCGRVSRLEALQCQKTLCLLASLNCEISLNHNF